MEPAQTAPQYNKVLCDVDLAPMAPASMTYGGGRLSLVLQGWKCRSAGCVRFFGIGLDGPKGYVDLDAIGDFTNVRSDQLCSEGHTLEPMYIQGRATGPTWVCPVCGAERSIGQET